MDCDVLIIGAGVTGAAAAREFSKHSVSVIILDCEADVSFGASKANSGIIHAGFHSEPGLLKTKLCVKANPMFDALSRDLDFPFERKGELMLAFSDEELDALELYYRRGVANGVPNLEILGRDATLEIEPNLNPDLTGSLLAPSAGVICPYEYCFALAENAIENGVRLFLGRNVTAIKKLSDGRLCAETAGGDFFKARFIVNAAGLFADGIAAAAGAPDFKITPRKGEEYLLDKRVGTLVKRVIFPVPGKNSKGMLVIPTVEGTVMVGPTAVDIQDKNDYSATAAGLISVFDHVTKMVPGVRSNDIITSFVGLRPVSDTDDFIIGKTSVPGFINAAGIQSPGLTASPAVAEMIVDVLRGEGLALTPNPSFSPRRKQTFLRTRDFLDKKDYAPLRAAAARDNGYNKIVCRCENVTEAEIVSAVRRGHGAMDGVKFAARAGCGRCQGAFCSSGVLEIISRETGVPVEKITKKGPGSEILAAQLEKGAPDDK